MASSSKPAQEQVIRSNSRPKLKDESPGAAKSQTSGESRGSETTSFTKQDPQELGETSPLADSNSKDEPAKLYAGDNVSGRISAAPSAAVRAATIRAAQEQLQAPTVSSSGGSVLPAVPGSGAVSGVIAPSAPSSSAPPSAPPSVPHSGMSFAPNPYAFYYPHLYPYAYFQPPDQIPKGARDQQHQRFPNYPPPFNYYVQQQQQQQQQQQFPNSSSNSNNVAPLSEEFKIGEMIYPPPFFGSLPPHQQVPVVAPESEGSTQLAEGGDDNQEKRKSRKRIPPPTNPVDESGKSNSKSVDRPYACPLEGCLWAFARLSDLKRHKKSHECPEFQCPYWKNDPTCHRNGGAFNRLDVLKRHLRLIHYVVDKEKKGESGDPGWCRVCRTVFPTSKQFLEHADKCAQNITVAEWKDVEGSRRQAKRGFEGDQNANSSQSRFPPKGDVGKTQELVMKKQKV
ncbi:hypothetical protein LJB42_001184 [Komagataella kurtzmanii]|nr:hypothetical protein LJB42_001184 [Komagataella kurtzmanii]